MRTVGNCSVYRCPHAFKVLNDLVGPKAENLPSMALHQCCAARIGFDLVGVMLTIDLDDEFSRYAGKISEVGANWQLTTKL